MTIARQELKVKVSGQGHGLWLARMVTRSVLRRSPIEGSLFSSIVHATVCLLNYANYAVAVCHMNLAYMATYYWLFSPSCS